MTTGYGFDGSLNSESSTNGKFVPAGIQENLEFTDISFVKNEPGKNDYLEVSMTDRYGRTVNKRFYEPSATQFKTLDQEIIKFNKVAQNLSHKFLGKEHMITGVTSFESLCRKLISDIGSLYKGVNTIRTKVVLNKDGFPTLPNYAPIWERGDEISVNDTKLIINPAFDKVTVEKPDEDVPPITSGGADDEF